MKNSHIQWCDHTFNGWEGCSKVSPGCAHCYAETRNARFGGGTAPNWGPGKPRRRTSASNWHEPVKWNREAQAAFQSFNQEVQGSFGHLSEMMEEPQRPRVFCASLSDWLDDEVPVEWRADLLTLIFDCGFLDWLLLTKRPQNFRRLVKAAAAFIVNHRDNTERNSAIAHWILDWVSTTTTPKAPENIWIGVSVEDQIRADERLPLLLSIPARVRFLSCEPLLGRIEFSNVTKRSDCVAQLGKPALDGIHWVIVGGESGPGARVTDLGAVESVIHQCRTVGVPCFVKQLGAKPEHDFAGYPGSHIERRLHLQHVKGGDMDEWPERFRVREFPEVAS